MIYYKITPALDKSIAPFIHSLNSSYCDAAIEFVLRPSIVYLYLNTACCVVVMILFCWFVAELVDASVFWCCFGYLGLVSVFVVRSDDILHEDIYIYILPQFLESFFLTFFRFQDCVTSLIPTPIFPPGLLLTQIATANQIILRFFVGRFGSKQPTFDG